MELKGRKVLTIIEDDFEDSELIYPHYRLQEAGADAIIAGPVAEKVYTGKNGVPVKSDAAFHEIEIREFDALLVPGGWAPDKLRRYDAVLDMVRHMMDHDKVIGQICHAGWVLISADVLKGKKVTSTPGIKHDMINAGAEWIDEPVTVDGKLVSSRRPPDLPDYGRELVKAIK
ncbi:type 1 glutamine amidotransferase domain-containing protein [Salisediminibacterium selenitireducens]|uniref:Intracellular protease, PfpI family n=1 Tax=Bacillus selenitireducens (strain ATCC 700615 / DSM 15326 / MLS10) TaxID=439292 RepID=D6XUC0_BACIE|nr:type 1 glutamine amidotransferase domain-containing protein [Salisediminibacterium selenitireducens]ADH99406.1 intracellular protease, PfpI family [[Bacillus] selenitireducens MLS10]